MRLFTVDLFVDFNNIFVYYFKIVNVVITSNDFLT